MATIGVDAAGPIQVIPPGLLSLLELKSPAGRAPQLMPLDLQPQIDLLKWYLIAKAAAVVPGGSMTVVTANVGFNEFTTNPYIVPDNEWWYVHYFSVNTAVLAAGDALGPMSVMAQIGGGVQLFNQLGPFSPSAVVGGNMTCAAFDFFLPPGARLGVNITSLTSLGLVVAGQLFATRLRS
jgi:hypothetical protein